MRLQGVETSRTAGNRPTNPAARPEGILGVHAGEEVKSVS
jgi:hypothetical protein